MVTDTDVDAMLCNPREGIKVRGSDQSICVHDIRGMAEGKCNICESKGLVVLHRVEITDTYNCGG